MTNPILFDWYCCEGGAARGYERAGFDVFGIDLFDEFTQGRYPYPSLKANALDLFTVWGSAPDARLPFEREGHVTWLSLDDADANHGSPPCQAASAGTRALDRSRYPRLIEPTREFFATTEKPWIIENVKGAALRNPAMLCGRMFGLSALDEDGAKLVLDRHRLFESNISLEVPEHPIHGAELVGGAYGGTRKAKRRPGESLESVAPRDRAAARNERGGGYVPRSKRVQQDLLGIDWMTIRGMGQSLPPVYTEYLGRQLRAAVTA